MRRVGLFHLEASCERVPREVGHIVERVVIRDDDILRIGELALVDDLRVPAILWQVERQEPPLRD